MAKKIAFIFPGQGSQKVGMGQEWAEADSVARQTFEEADDTLRLHLQKLCFEGPEDELQLTANTQPALLAVSTAILRVVRRAGLEPAFVAGHSLGEYSADVAAEALAFPEALMLVRSRGRFMQEAVPTGVGAMAAIMGLDADAVDAIARDATAAADGDDVCAVANYNSPLQTVVSGHLGAVEHAVELGRERGAKRSKLLPVSAPFHSPLMRPARDALAPLLADADIRAPQTPVVTNVDAAPATSVDAVRDSLVRQVDAPVRWVETVHRMVHDGVEVFVEVGPGTVLKGNGKRTEKDVSWHSLTNPNALDKLLAEL